MKILKNNITKRAKTIINLNQFNKKNKAELIGNYNIDLPKERLYVLRMLVKTANSDFLLPDNILFLKDMLKAAIDYQKHIGVNHSFCYITVRNGLVTSETDDEWHVDGFSTRISHIPEQNYIWTDVLPTEIIYKSLDINDKFNPLVHNLHYYIQDSIQVNDKIITLKEKTIYCIDPYVIHRRPFIPENTNRCFIRISFVPIEINDVNNTINSLLATNYTKNGVTVRNQLKRFKIK